MRPPNLPGYGAAALVAITGVAGGEREAAMGIAAAVGPSPQVRGRWIMMAGALPRPVSCVCVLLSSLLLCTRVRVVFVGAAAVEFAVVCFFSLSLSPLSPLSLPLFLSCLTRAPSCLCCPALAQTLAFLCLTLLVNPLPF
jgi:hypothetical protein